MDKMAACVADALGNAEIGALLRSYGHAPPREACPAGLPHDAPLLSLMSATK
jgi:hypothetical protein